MIRQPQVKPYHLKHQNPKHVKIIKVSDKVTYDTSLERGLDLEIRVFNYQYNPTSSGETIPSQTSNT